MTTLPATIRALLASSPWNGLLPFAINNGECEAFQQDIIEAAGLDGREVERCTSNYDAPGMPGHCWVEVEGRHYDAEAPDGVDDREDLPCFKAWSKQRAERAAKGGA